MPSRGGGAGGEDASSLLSFHEAVDRVSRLAALDEDALPEPALDDPVRRASRLPRQLLELAAGELGLTLELLERESGPDPALGHLLGRPELALRGQGAPLRVRLDR